MQNDLNQFEKKIIFEIYSLDQMIKSPLVQNGFLEINETKTG